MNNIEQYRKRFYNLMESTMGDVRPILSEQPTQQVPKKLQTTNVDPAAELKKLTSKITVKSKTKRPGESAKDNIPTLEWVSPSSADVEITDKFITSDDTIYVGILFNTTDKNIKPLFAKSEKTGKEIEIRVGKSVKDGKQIGVVKFRIDEVIESPYFDDEGSRMFTYQPFYTNEVSTIQCEFKVDNTVLHFDIFIPKGTKINPIVEKTENKEMFSAVSECQKYGKEHGLTWDILSSEIPTNCIGNCLNDYETNLKESHPDKMEGITKFMGCMRTKIK